ncbi:MAG: EAL domain-containing protein [Steroidobacteraceae bacterium]|jgi:EAL domain-containing protein (putative c-di-GMP-specific phosphodiesterase class I)
MEQGKPFSATESPLVDFDAVCQKVRAAFEPARAHAVSLHDENGDLLWLSESSMGPDEHNAVREALESFARSDSPPVLAYDLGDARSAVLLRAVNARRALVGAVMVIMDTRSIKADAGGLAKLLTPRLQRALTDFAGMRPDIEPSAGQAPAKTPAPAPVSAKPSASSKPSAGAKPSATSQTAKVRALAAAAPASVKVSVPAGGKSTAAAPHGPKPSAAAAPAGVKAPPQSAGGARAVAHAAPASRPHDAPPAHPSSGTSGARESSAPQELSLADSTRVPVVRAPSARAADASPARPERSAPPDSADKRAPEISPEIDRLHAALRRSPIALHVQRLVPLTKGSQLKRYEVLLRSKGDDAPNAAPHAMLKAAVDNGLGSMIDRRVITELVGWLVHHPDVWQSNAVMFSVNLTATALHDEHFIKFVGLCLAKSSLPKAMIAFEVDVATAVKLSSRVAEVAASLHRLGCPLVLDDFALKTECFDLLRLPGIRYVKLAPEITANMRTDKISQASITAVVQMARVLGMHTVAKRTETPAEQEWLTALGVDFVQSHAMSPPAAIETLSKARA